VHFPGAHLILELWRYADLSVLIRSLPDLANNLHRTILIPFITCGARQSQGW
jgi:hypothetical protein